MLRATVIALGVGCLVGAVLIARLARPAWPAALELGIFGILILLGTLFELRYRFPTAGKGVNWEATGERFKDPVSGKLTEVRWNRATGERAYVTIDP
ncbi:MAG TPA: hypothetical protein VGF86_15195 [Candidatus Tumulicola sp.]|jgi:hypothetical protein